MTFKKTNSKEQKMVYKNYTAYIYKHLGTFNSTYYLTIRQERYDGQFYETFTLVNEKEFYKLNEAKRFAKDYIS